VTTFGHRRPARHQGALIAGRYRLERLVASGGTAEVWEATDEMLRRRVAVKLLHHHLVDTVAARRFRLEGITTAGLRHPNAVSVFDTIAGPGIEAIVMEFVDGTTLRERLDREGPLDVATAVSIAVEVAGALDDAHRHGLVHRDVKPGNILLTTGGAAKVTDFGIATSGGAGDLTVPGTFLGTAKYLAPEQVEGASVDARADVYALGATLYEMVTGRPPFDGPSDAAIALSRLHTVPVAADVLRPGVPPRLARVLQRALARHPTDRFDDMRSFAAALRATTGRDDTRVMASPVPSPPAPRPTAVPARRWVVAAVCLFVSVASLVVAALLIERSDSGDLVRRVRDVIGVSVGGPDADGPAVRPAPR
jgi:eukaryotic-like serine/threonine-protein kinase